MEFSLSDTLTHDDKIAVYRLWNREYPKKLHHQSLQEFEAYLNNLKQIQHILVRSGGAVIGWCFIFERDQENWFAMIVDHSHQGKGLGSKLLDKAKEITPELNGWVIDHNNEVRHDGEPYRSPLFFYLKNSFSWLPDDRLELDKLSAVKIRWSAHQQHATS